MAIRSFHHDTAIGKVSIWISILVSLVKSRTIVYGFAIAALGTFLIASGTKIPDFFAMGRVVASAYLVALATYLYNDLTDYNIDQINDRKVVYDSKKTQYYTTLYSTIGFFFISILLAFSINVTTGLTSLAFFGLAIAYSHPNTHLKDRFLIKTLVTASGGFIASMMGSLAAENLSYLVIVSSSIVFLFYFVNGPLNDIRDMRGDREGGRRTIPIVIGVQKSFFIIILTIFLVALITLISYFFLGIHIIGMVLGLAVCAHLLLRIKKLSKHYEDKKYMNQTRTVVRNSMFANQIALLIGLVLNSVIIQ